MSATAFIGGRILSMDPRVGEPEALVVRDGRMADAGERGLLAAHPDAVVNDLGGRTLLPGLIDAHHHLSIAALHPVWADLSGASSVEELQAALREQAEGEPAARWVRGAGWDHTRVIPTRADLDALALDRPIVVAHFSLHQCVVCSRGLDELQIGRTTPDPPGGLIDRGPDGEPTGLLVERACSEANARSLDAYADPDRWADHIETRARELLADGITCVHDAACVPAAESVYARLAAEGRLPLSVVVMPHPDVFFSGVDAARLEGPATGEGEELLRVGHIKLFADGGIAPRIEATIAGARIDTGFAFPGLGDAAALAAEHGFRVAVHAMGNVGLENTLDALRPLARGDDDHRFRIEHATLASPEQAREMAALGAVGVVQPGFLDMFAANLGGFQFDELTWLPLAMLAEEGVELAASSDSPCTFHQPLVIAARGATRRAPGGEAFGPEEAMPYEEWLRAYTAGAAYAGGQEHERGTLTPGKRADLVVLEGKLDGENPPRVAETWVAGDRVYDAS